MEQWKAIKGTNGDIEVSNYGRIRSNLRTHGFILKAQKDNKGYLRISVTLNRTKQRYKVHRAVAMAFIPNPNNLPQVNHIDGNKENNSSFNLEWCTNKENARHAINNGLWVNVLSAAKKANDSKKRPIIATEISTGNDYPFESMSDAERAIGTRHINDVIKGIRKQANGYTFRYALGGDANA